MKTTRRRFSALMAAVIPASAATWTSPKQPTRPRKVTQRELQAILDLFNRSEKLAADIRARIEAGAEFERGKLGISTCGAEPLEWYLERDNTGNAQGVDAIVGLTIEPAKRIRDHDAVLIQRYPNNCPKAFALF